MGQIVRDTGRFWPEALHALNEFIEKGAHEVADRPAREQGLPLRNEPCPNKKEKPGRCQ